jgi:hypothetical protein
MSLDVVAADRQSVTFVLDNLSDLDALIAGLPDGAEVHRLNSSGDALAQMSSSRIVTCCIKSHLQSELTK